MRPRYDLELVAVCDEPGAFFDPRPGIVFLDRSGELEGLSTSSVCCTERLSLDGIAFQAAG
jgi:hypothetical protein